MSDDDIPLDPKAYTPSHAHIHHRPTDARQVILALTRERDEARAERDAVRKIVLDAAHEDAEWRDKEIWPLDGDIYQNWRIVLYLPVPVTQADKEISSALDRAIAAAIAKNAG